MIPDTMAEWSQKAVVDLKGEIVEITTANGFYAAPAEYLDEHSPGKLARALRELRDEGTIRLKQRFGTLDEWELVR